MSHSYYRGYRIVLNEGVWFGRYLEITPVRPELSILRNPRISVNKSETAALEEAHRIIDDLFK